MLVHRLQSHLSPPSGQGYGGRLHLCPFLVGSTIGDRKRLAVTSLWSTFLFLQMDPGPSSSHKPARSIRGSSIQPGDSVLLKLPNGDVRSVKLDVDVYGAKNQYVELD